MENIACTFQTVKQLLFILLPIWLRHDAFPAMRLDDLFLPMWWWSNQLLNIIIVEHFLLQQHCSQLQRMDTNICILHTVYVRSILIFIYVRSIWIFMCIRSVMIFMCVRSVLIFMCVRSIIQVFSHMSEA